MRTKQPKNQNEQPKEKPEVPKEPDNTNVGNVGITSPEHPEEKKVKEIENKHPAEKVESEIDKALNEYKSAPAEESMSPKKRTRKQRKPKEPEQEQHAFVIPGDLFVTVCDNVMTGGIGLIDSLIAPKDPVDTNHLRLTEKQTAQLGPIAEAALKEMKLSDKPIEVFFGSLGAIYLSNYFTLRNHMKYESNNAKDKSKAHLYT